MNDNPTGQTFATFLERVVDDGIQAAKDDYTRPEQRPKLEGSIAGFITKGIYRDAR